MANRTLSAAKKGKNDEFYTQWIDIETEINAYLEYNPNVFNGKTILLPADDPFESNFFKYFATKFNEFGIHKLIATSYSRSHIVNTQLSLLPDLVPEIDKAKKNKKAYKIELTEVNDENENGAINLDDVITRLKKEKQSLDLGRKSEILSYLVGDCKPDGTNNFEAGDFRSKEVSDLRDEADIIITNPPFSLFREFMLWLQPEKRNFLVISNMNAITYKEIFPLIKENKMWMGKAFGRDFKGFIIPEDYPLSGSEARVDEEGNRIVSTNNTIWFTNLDHGRRHQPLALMTMEDNLKFSKHAAIKGKEKYGKYDNFDAIEVPFTDAIPSDYEGVMGVPISFLHKYSPEQFEILGCSYDYGRPSFFDKNVNMSVSINGENIYKRILIRHKK